VNRGDLQNTTGNHHSKDRGTTENMTRKYYAEWNLHGQRMSASANSMEELRVKVFGSPSAPASTEVRWYTIEP